MAIDLATGFNIGSKDVIDERQVLTLEQMKNLDESIYPDKYFAICKDNGKLYLYDASNEVDGETGKFRVLEGSGTADLTGYKKIYTSLSELGLDSADSLYDIMAKMERGEMFLGSTSEYNSSWFPKYEYGIFRIIKGKEVNYSDTTVEWLSSQYGEYAIANLGENSLEEWIFIRRSEEKSFYRSSYSLNEWNLLAKIKFSSSDLNKKHILSFSCSNKIFSKFNSCDLCKYELHFTIPDSECKLTEFGLVLYEYPMPEGTDDGLKNLSKNIGLYYDEDNLCIYIFIINTTDVNYLEGRYIADSLNYFSLEYTGTGVIINSFGTANQGVTWDERWGSLCAFEDLEYPTIVPIGGESSSTEGASTYTSLTDLGLTAPVSVGEVFNAMPNKTMAVLACEAKDEAEGTVTISDMPMSFGVLTIKKNEQGRFSIEYQNSLNSSPCNVKRWIGTLKGADGTGLYWKEISTQTTYTILSDMGLTADATVQDVIDALPVGCTALLRTDAFTNWSTLFDGIQWGYFKVEKTASGLSNIELQEVVLPNRRYFGAQSGGKFNKWQKVASEITDVLTNNSTIVQVPNAKLVAGEIHGKYFDIVDYSDALTMPAGKWRVDSNSKASQMQNLPVSKAGILEVKYLHGNDGLTAYTGSFKYAMLTYTDIDGNKYERAFNSDGTVGNIANDTGWRKIQTSGDKATLVTNTATLKLDVTKRSSGWYGAIKLTYLYDTSPAEIEISFRSATDDLRWAVINGQKYIKKITFTQDSSNTAHYTIGIEFSGTTYGCYQAEVIGDFANINSLTSEAFTGAKTAVYYSPWGKNNGVTLVSAPEDLGLTFPCTTVQLAQSMRNKFNKTITAGAIGVFDCGGKATTITDAPSDYGLLHIETFGYDRILIRFDGIASSSYTGSWIGQIQGNNGTFSSITWEKIPSDTRVTTLETQVSELFQSVSNGKTLVANAITGKGVSTSSTATFATMATNISKIKGYKEETKSFPVPLTGSTTITSTFSADVLGIKQIILPTDSSRLIPQATLELFKIEGKNVTMTITGVGTWQVTALIKA